MKRSKRYNTMKYNPFLRWLLIVVPLAVIMFLAGQMGFYKELYLKDKSWLSYTTLVIFVLSTVWCGRMTYRMDDKHIEFGWFMSDQCLTLGMIGTVVGFLMMLTGGVDPAHAKDISSVQSILAKFSIGLSTALYTTLVGLICSMFLKLQLFNLAHTIELNKNGK